MSVLDTNEGSGPGARWRVSCCGSIIQSMNVHDMVWCKCGKSAIDGGDAYTRTAGKWENFSRVTEDDDENT